MEKLSNNKIFITGITGFTGIHLEEYLIKNGFEVFGSTLKKTKKPTHFICDILDSQALYDVLNKVKPNFIIHLAAISFVATKDLNKIYEINIFGSLNLLEAINKLTYKVQKIIISSSAAVYGNVAGELSEDNCPEPVNHYGNSKLVMENMIKQYFNTQNIIITRPFNYTGVGHGNNFLVPKIVSHYKKNKKEIELGNTNTYREYNDINFVIKCYYKLLLSKESSIIVNVCSGKTNSIDDLLTIMNKQAGYRINVKVNSKFIRENEILELKGSKKRLVELIGDFTKECENDIEKTLETMYLN